MGPFKRLAATVDCTCESFVSNPNDENVIANLYIPAAMSSTSMLPRREKLVPCSPLVVANIRANRDIEAVITALSMTCTYGNPDQRMVATLLCTSKDLQAAITQSYACTSIAAHITARTSYWSLVGSFGVWLGRHGSMLRSLTISLPYERYSWPGTPSSAEIVAAALQQGATHATLQLESYLAQDEPSSFPEILQQLPCNTLTRLTVVATQDMLTDDLGSLTRLSNLRSLDFAVQEYLRGVKYITTPMTSTSLPGVFTALAHLTHLRLDGMNQIAPATELYPYLPITLQELQLPREYAPAPTLLDISHLTALTGLLYGYTLQEADMLPTSLIKLTIDDATSLEPLLPLKQLKLLTVNTCNLTAQQLQEVAKNMTSLQAVQLAHKQLASIDAAAAGWHYLPIHTLNLWVPSPAEDYLTVSSTSLLQLGKLRCLRYLTITNVDLGNSSQRDALSEALRQLASVQVRDSTGNVHPAPDVSLHQVQQQQQQRAQPVEWFPKRVLKLLPGLFGRFSLGQLQSKTASAKEAAGSGQVGQGRSSIGAAAFAAPNWEKALIAADAATWDVPLAQAHSSRSAAARASLPRLTGLSLERGNLDDSSATALLQSCKQLGGLQQLDLSENSGITDTLLRAIAKAMPGLATLRLRFCDVSEAGVAGLMTKMKRLEVVDARGKKS